MVKRGVRGRGGRRGRGSYRNRVGIHSSEPMKFNENHMKLDIVKYLQENSLESLDNFRVLVKRHRKYPNLVELHYQQSASFKDQIPRECRGIILDESRNF